tara:strand:- start:2773 stop:3345 length:573 start_codon:yes stop_codon:yes gene_type:complete
MIVAIIILGVVFAGLWMYMRRTTPHTAVDEEARQEAILKRRMESKASRTEVDRLGQIAQGKKEIEELQKPFVGAPMPDYDPSQIEQDPEKRKKKIRDAMGVDSGSDTLPVVEYPDSDLTASEREHKKILEMFQNHDVVFDDENWATHGYDKKTGNLIWVEDRLANGMAGDFRYANKDDFYAKELKDFITA